MKKVLFAGLLAVMCAGASAQNLIKNNDFATEVSTTVPNPSKATAGEWFILNNEKDGATSITWGNETGDKKYPAAMKFDNSDATANLSWYKVLLGQRITDGLEKGIYNLTFYAKGKEADSQVSVYIKQTVEEKNADTGKYNTTFFARKDYDGENQPNASAAQYNYKLKDGDKWTKVSVDFDMAKVANAISSKKSNPALEVSATPSDAAILNDCYVAILGLNKGNIIEISDVTLKKK